MKRPLTLALLALILLCPNPSLFAQNEANIWYFGTNAGMDFNPGPPVALTNGALATTEGCAAISDATTGQLLFYTDGVTVYNRNHVVMTNGTGLMGNFSSTQSCIIVPHPGQSNLYYIITVDDVGGANGLRYSIVDMNQSGGFGSVTGTKNVVLLPQCTEKLTTACHGNGTDYWVITHGWNSSDFYAWHVGTGGLNTTPVISTSGSFHGGSTLNTLGELEVSPDGSRIALCSWYGTINEVFDFNNNTGVVSNAISLTASGEDYGCAFSPDGSKVYYVSCCVSPNDVVQFDLNAGNQAAINASRTVIAGGGTTRGHAQIGPDGRVYIARYLQGSLSVINNPNVAGAGSGFVEVGFNLAGRTCQLGLPNMVSCLVIIFDLEFVSFTGEMLESGEVALHWEAVEERQQGEYVVERSPDGAYFYPIGEIDFRGQGDAAVSHDFQDRAPLPGDNYYRIRFVNSNGETSVSEIVLVKPEQDLNMDMSWGPNPATDHVSLEMMVPAEARGDWAVRIFAPDGKQVYQTDLGPLAPGRFTRDFPLGGLAAGFYYVEVRNGGQQAVQSLVKK